MTYTVHDLLADHQRYHTEYQMDLFITAKSGGTPWGMYRQALRELASRHDSVELGALEIEELELDLADLPQATPREKIAWTRKRMALDSARAAQRDKRREYERFLAQARALKRQLGPLTPERSAQLEREYWAFHARKRAALELACNRAISTATLEMIWSLDDRDTAAILEEIEQHHDGRPAMLAWLERHQGASPLAIAEPATNEHPEPCPVP